MGADIVVNQKAVDAWPNQRLTGGKGVDVAIEALGPQARLKMPCAASGRGNGIEPGSLFGAPHDCRGAVCSRLGESKNHHDALPRRERKDAQADRTCASRPPGSGSTHHAHIQAG